MPSGPHGGAAFFWTRPALADGGAVETSRCARRRIDELESATSASPAPAASADPAALLPHLPAPRFTHPLVDPLLRWRTPVALSGSGNGLPTEAPHGRRFGLLRHTCGSCRRAAVHSLQEIGGAVSNASELCAERLRIEPSLGLGLRGTDQGADLLRQYQQLLLNEITGRRRCSRLACRVCPALCHALSLVYPVSRVLLHSESTDIIRAKAMPWPESARTDAVFTRRERPSGTTAGSELAAGAAVRVQEGATHERPQGVGSGTGEVRENG